MNKKYTQSGFSLVELAIALTVIGLLLAGLMKATELLENSRVNAVITQSGHYQSAIVSFRSMYGTLPGDMTDPERINGCADIGYCNVAGNGDGMIWDGANSDFIGGVLNGESRRVWIQLAKADLVQTVDPLNDGVSVTRRGGVDYPATPFEGGVFDLHFSKVTTTAIVDVGEYPPERVHYLKTRPSPMTTAELNLLTPRQTHQLDLKMDDGFPHTGRVVSWRWNREVCGEKKTVYDYGSAATEATDQKCDVWIRMEL